MKNWKKKIKFRNVQKKIKIQKMNKKRKNENFEVFEKNDKIEKFTQNHIYRRDINVFMSRGCWHMFISQKTRSRKNLIFFMFWSISAR